MSKPMIEFNDSQGWIDQFRAYNFTPREAIKHIESEFVPEGFHQETIQIEDENDHFDITVVCVDDHGRGYEAGCKLPKIFCGQAPVES